MNEKIYNYIVYYIFKETFKQFYNISLIFILNYYFSNKFQSVPIYQTVHGN